MNIIFTEMRTVTDAQVVMIESARFRGSEPFRGVFKSTMLTLVHMSMRAPENDWC